MVVDTSIQNTDERKRTLLSECKECLHMEVLKQWRDSYFVFWFREQVFGVCFELQVAHLTWSLGSHHQRRWNTSKQAGKDKIVPFT